MNYPPEWASERLFLALSTARPGVKDNTNCLAPPFKCRLYFKRWPWIIRCANYSVKWSRDRWLSSSLDSSFVRSRDRRLLGFKAPTHWLLFVQDFVFKYYDFWHFSHSQQLNFRINSSRFHPNLSTPLNSNVHFCSIKSTPISISPPARRWAQLVA